MTLTSHEAREAARAHLSEEAFAHSERVAETAASLAGIYGVDAEKVQIAALLHDWARDLEGDDLVEAARGLGFEVTRLDREVPYLLHARVGAAQVRAELPALPEASARAVATHTCGAGQMGGLEKVVYVADMIEPARTFEGIEPLRRAVGAVDLDELFKLAYTRSILHLIETRRHIHPDTVAVWNQHVAGLSS